MVLEVRSCSHLLAHQDAWTRGPPNALTFPLHDDTRTVDLKVTDLSGLWFFRGKSGHVIQTLTLTRLATLQDQLELLWPGCRDEKHGSAGWWEREGCVTSGWKLGCVLILDVSQQALCEICRQAGTQPANAALIP